MNEEIKEVAVKMADYADEEQSRLLNWVRCISLLGVVFMAIILAKITQNKNLIVTCKILVIGSAAIVTLLR